MSDPVKFGMTLSSEEHPPRRLVELAVLAEEHGFDFVSVSDHFHPWVDEQGHSPFVWSVLGAIAAATDVARRGRRGDVPDHAHPPGGAGPGHGNDGSAAGGPLHLGCRHRRGAQRAHPR